jgi:hypothetical protein
MLLDAGMFDDAMSESIALATCAASIGGGGAASAYGSSYASSGRRAPASNPASYGPWAAYGFAPPAASAAARSWSNICEGVCPRHAGPASSRLPQRQR